MGPESRPSAALPAPEPVARVLRTPIHDLDHLRSAVRAPAVDVVQLGRGPFRADFVTSEAGGVRVTRCEQPQGLRVRATTTPGYVALVVPLRVPGPAALSGERVTAGRVLLFGPGSGYEGYTPPGYVYATVHVPLQVWGARAERWGGAEPLVPGSAPVALRLTPRLRAGAAALGARCAWAQPGEPEQAAQVAQAVEAWLDLLLPACVPGSRRPPRSTPDRAARLIREAEGCLEARPEACVYVGDLCAALGVSERTLQHVFLRRLSLSPLAYLRRRRLHGVRGELRRLVGTPGATVKAVARAHGFLHTGRFASEYRAVFGEAPAVTLGVRGGERASRSGRA